MFIFWFIVFLICCGIEQLGLIIDAYKYNKQGGFYAEHPCCAPKDYQLDDINKTDNTDNKK